MKIGRLYTWLRANPIASITAMHLLQENGRLTSRELSELMGVSQATASKILTSLDSKGLVELGRKRGMPAALTPKGLSELNVRIVELSTIVQ